MPVHGDHWETLYSAEDYVHSKISRDVQEGYYIGSTDCVDVKDGTDRTEQVACLRWGGDRLANQILVVSNSAKQSNFLFSGYPIALDGVPTEVTISKVEPWEYGIEGWIRGSVTSEAATLSRHRLSAVPRPSYSSSTTSEISTSLPFSQAIAMSLVGSNISGRSGRPPLPSSSAMMASRTNGDSPTLA